MQKIIAFAAAVTLWCLINTNPLVAYDVGEDKDLDACRTVSADPKLHEEWRKKQIAACTTLLKRTDKLATDSHYEAFFHRGRAHAEASDELAAAISDFSEVIKLNVAQGPYMERGKAYQEKGDFAAAARDYDTATRIAPNNAYLTFLKGTLSDDLSKADEAIALYTDAIRLNPKLFDAYLRRGMAMRRKGDVDRAIANYSEAIRISPKDWRTFYNRGNAYNQKGDNDRAIQDFSEAIALYPESSNSFLNRGIALAAKLQFDRAIADFNAAIKLAPNDPHIYYNRGDLLAKMSKFEAAIADFSVSLKIDPRYSDSNRLRGYAFLQIGRANEALADFDAAINLDSTDGDAYIARARLLAKKGDVDGMKRDYDRATAIFPSDTALAQERLSALGGSPVTADVLAIVNGTTISKADVDSVLNGMAPAERERGGTAEKVLIALIDRILLAHESAKFNLSLDDLLAKRRGALFNDTALASFYERNKARYTSDFVKASHILVPTEREAKDILRIANPSKFAELAKARSKGPSASEGGSLGWFNREKMLPEFAEVAFNTPVGSVSRTLVPSQFGWHVILVEDRKDKFLPSLADINDQVANDLIEDIDRVYLSELKSRASIKVTSAVKQK